MALTHRVELRIASQCRCGKPLAAELRKREIERAARMLAETFGGAETCEVKGFFVMSDGRLAVERVCVVSAHTEELTAAHLATLELHTRGIAYALDQESVAIVLDGIMDFYAPNTERACAHKDDR